MHVVDRVVTVLGQALERALTGRSEFRLSAMSPDPSSVIQDAGHARLALRDVQAELAEGFDIRLRDPVLVDLQEPPPWGWKAALAGAGRQLGRYAPGALGPDRVHRILVVPGLPRPQFRGVLAHELVHAWQVENGILRSRGGLREGMARWVEYHVLLRTGRQDLAKRLLALRRYSLGRHVRHILEHEGREGRHATLRWLLTLDG